MIAFLDQMRNGKNKKPRTPIVFGPRARLSYDDLRCYLVGSEAIEALRFSLSVVAGSNPLRSPP
jgi:hypothetical protein